MRCTNASDDHTRMIRKVGKPANKLTCIIATVTLSVALARSGFDSGGLTNA